MAVDSIIIKGAREHNLKSIDVKIPRDKLVVITGPSGSGKTSLAFDTIYAEGQRRYVESLAVYARQFLEQMKKPDVDSIEGLSPAISIEQKNVSRNPRSTVGTVTEIYDYLRLLFARIGKPFCYQCEKPIQQQTVQEMVDLVLALGTGTKLGILAPLIRGRKGEYTKEFQKLRKDGFVRIKVDGETFDLEQPPALDKNKKHEIDVYVDRIVIKDGINARIADSIETALKLADGLVAIEPSGKERFVLSERFACIDCGISYPEISPRFFSFNNPHGACKACDGLGETMTFDPDLVVPDPSLSIREGAIHPWRNSDYYYQVVTSVLKHLKAEPTTPFQQLSHATQQALLNGSVEQIRFHYEGDGSRHEFYTEFEGVLPNLYRRYRESDSDRVKEDLERYMTFLPCTACQGSRLRKEAQFIKVAGAAIHEVTALSVEEAVQWATGLTLSRRDRDIARRILKEISDRLEFLHNVGLSYLTLNRKSGTLSGGEGQRIRLATQIGSQLVGVLYILDEPSIGLHQRDNGRLLATLKKLRDLGNTVLVVEHDEDTIRAADFVLDMGPAAGVHGGRVVVAGDPAAVAKDRSSITGAFLSGRRSIAIPAIRRQPARGVLRVAGASHHNLKHIDAEIPIGTFTCVTGVSGSGKSTLVVDTLYKGLMRELHQSRAPAGNYRRLDGVDLIDKVIDIDQSPIGRTPRSNPATYTGLFTPIRELFAELPESKMRGYAPGRYSFNVKGGRCEACSGDGIIKIEMHFLPDIYVDCEICQGKRYNRETLDIGYKEKNIADILAMTVDEAVIFFAKIPAIASKLQTLKDVGLGYIALGQQATTLSGGEAQRVKLSRELSKRSTGRTLYILDEPTTGLHFADIEQLLGVLQQLVNAGNTVVVIEHNLEVIKVADHIIDLGPEGGDGGGELIAVGTPEAVAKNRRSYTGKYLKPVLTRGNPVDRHRKDKTDVAVATP